MDVKIEMSESEAKRPTLTKTMFHCHMVTYHFTILTAMVQRPRTLVLKVFHASSTHEPYSQRLAQILITTPTALNFVIIMRPSENQQVCHSC
jgi:hypothetical protein